MTRPRLGLGLGARLSVVAVCLAAAELGGQSSPTPLRRPALPQPPAAGALVLVAPAGAPLQPLIDQIARAGGGTLRLGPGRWVLPTPPAGGCALQLTSRLRLEGAGARQTRLEPASSPAHYQTLLCEPPTGLTDLTIAGLTLAQPRAADGPLVVRPHARGHEAALLRLARAQRVHVREVWLESVGVNGLLVSGPTVADVTLERVGGRYRRVGAADYDNSLIYLNGVRLWADQLDLQSGVGGHGGLELHGGPAFARQVRVRGYGTAVNLVGFSPPSGRPPSAADSARRNALWLEQLDADSVARGVALWTTPQMLLRDVRVQDSRIRIVPARHPGQSLSGVSVAWGVRDPVGGTGHVTGVTLQHVDIQWDTTAGAPVRPPVLESAGLSLVGGALLDSVYVAQLRLLAPPFAAVRLGNGKAAASRVGAVTFDGVYVSRAGWAATRGSECIPWRLEQSLVMLRIRGLVHEGACRTAPAWAVVHPAALGALTQTEWSRLGAFYRQPVLVLR